MSELQDSPPDLSYGCFGIVCIWMARAMMVWAAVVMPAAFAIGMLHEDPGLTQISLGLAFGAGALVGAVFAAYRWQNPPGWAAALGRCHASEYRGKLPRPMLRASRPGWRNPFDYTGDETRDDR